MSTFTHFDVFHQFSSVFREELTCHIVYEKGVRTIHKAKVSTSFQRPEQGVRLIYGCVLYTRNYGICIHALIIHLFDYPKNIVFLVMITIMESKCIIYS